MSGRGIIFDFDGTLAHTLPDIAEALNAGLRHFGLRQCPESQVRDWIGEGMSLLCRRAIGDDSRIPLDQMVDMVSNHYREHRLDKVRPFEGIEALLDELVSRGFPLAVLTNKPHVHTVPMMQALFGAWPFLAIEGYQIEERRKPDPRTSLEIAARMLLPPAEILMVGDSFTDVQTALNAGMIPVGCTWGYRSRQELLDAGARHLIDRPAQLLDLLPNRGV